MKFADITRKFRRGAVFLLFLGALFAAGCGVPKEAREARDAGIEALENENYAEAVRFFDSAYRDARDKDEDFKLDVLKYRAETQYRIGDFEETAKTCRRIAETEKTAENYYLLSAAESASGYTDAASKDYETALSLEGKKGKEKETPGAELAFAALADALRKGGEPEAAAALGEKRAESGWKDAETALQTGISWLEAGDYGKAETWLSDADKLANDAGDHDMSLRVLYNRAVLAEYRGDFAGALQLFKNYRKEVPESPEADKEITFLESRIHP